MRKTKKPKPISKSKRILQLCDILGIKTFDDMQLFKKHVQNDGEKLIDALERYFLEVFDESTTAE